MADSQVYLASILRSENLRIDFSDINADKPHHIFIGLWLARCVEHADLAMLRPKKDGPAAYKATGPVIVLSS